MGPAHFPVLKPQQEEAQAESDVQGPVMNCVPWECAVVRKARREKKATEAEYMVLAEIGWIKSKIVIVCLRRDWNVQFSETCTADRQINY